MRDYLQAAGVEFDDRNIRQDEAARHELQERTGDLVVPQLFYGEQVIVGFDPDALDEVVATYKARAS